MRLPLAAILATAALSPTLAAAQPAAPGPTLAAVRAKGTLDCGVSAGTPGYSFLDSQGVYQGFDVTFCRAIAAAVLNDPTRVRFIPVQGPQRLPTLQSGQIDVLISTVTWTQSRDTANGLNFAGVNFYDGQSFLVRRSANVTEARQLDGATICVTAGSTSELNVADWARSNRIRYSPVVFERNEETRNAYATGRCDSYSTDASQLAAARSALPNPAEHVVLGERISKEPLGPVVRQGDDQWFDIVKWTLYALIEAEEQGVTQANADAMRENPAPAIRRLLGLTGNYGQQMGLDDRWAYWAIRAVGNYGEIYERYLGEHSPVGLPRGVNNLWNRGGLMYAPPIR